MRDIKEINDQMNEASIIVSEGRSDVPGMSYEEGVEAALRWVTGESDELPIEQEG